MKPKLLIISLNIPYPLTNGGAVAQYYFLEKLVQDFDLIFCTLLKYPGDVGALQALQQSLPGLRAVSFNAIPQQEEPPGVLISGLRKIKDWLKRRLSSAQPVQVSRSKDDFSHPFFLDLMEVLPAGFIELVKRTVAAENITLAQLDFYDTLSLTKALPDGVVKVFVHHEIRTKRLELSAQQSSQPNAFKDYLIACTRLVEYGFIRQADRVIVFNEKDKNLLSGIHNQVFVSPFGIPNEMITRKQADEQFDRFLFIGGQYHRPNYDGLCWLLDEVYLPYYEQLPWSLYIVGFWEDEFKTKYKAHSKIIFTGIVDKLDDYFQRSVLVTPIFSGSGLRTKILHALANYVPVLTSEFACEGLESNAAEPYLSIFHSPGDFLVQATALINHQSEIRKLASSGKKFYEDHFSESRLTNLRLQALGLNVFV